MLVQTKWMKKRKVECREVKIVLENQVQHLVLKQIKSSRKKEKKIVLQR